MTGATLVEFDNQDVLRVINQAVDALDDPTLIHEDMGEYLLQAHIARFAAQQSPDGTPWTPLSPRYQRRKRKNTDKILILDGYLSGTLRWQADAEGVDFGSDRAYAAIHQFGGEIQHAARSQEAFFKRRRDGSVGNRFVRKDKSDFAQRVTIGAHATTIPARPFLGTSESDDQQLLAIARRHLERAINR